MQTIFLASPLFFPFLFPLFSFFVFPLLIPLFPLALPALDDSFLHSFGTLLTPLASFV